MIFLKNAFELEKMRYAGSIVAQILDEMQAQVKPGISTFELDHYAAQRCRELKVQPAFQGYHGFPACVCISVNDEVVHGIPSKKRFLKEGDIVGLDFGVSFEGWFGDSARTIAVGTVTDEAQQLIQVTQTSLQRGIEMCLPGHHVSDIGHVIQNYVESFGFSVVREFVGHGIGKSLHEDPQVPNYGVRGQGPVLKVGMVLAIEPMVNRGLPEVRILSDGWTAVTVDQSLSAHCEHTVAITEQGPEILTQSPS